MHGTSGPAEPRTVGMPWLYELAMEVYRAAKTGNAESIERELKRLRRLSEFIMRGPFMEELGMGRKEYHMIAMEFPRMLEHTLQRTLEMSKPPSRKEPKASSQQEDSNE